MTLTTLTSPIKGPIRRQGGSPSGPAPSRAPSAGRPVPPGTPLNGTIEVTLPLDSANRGVLETLEALRETVREIGEGTVRAVPGPSMVSYASGQPDSDCLLIIPEERSVW